MKKRKIRFLLILVTTLMLVAAMFYAFSPARMDTETNEQVVSYEIIINRSPEQVFDYLGDSKNAETWSTYVKTIETLNPNEYADGAKGSRRRCFCKDNVAGEHWDEEILSVEANKSRQLSIYNLVDFPVELQGLTTWQRYEDWGEGATKLTFTLNVPTEDLGLWGRIKYRFAAYYVSDIFKNNLHNIKKDVEIKHSK